jgi:tetratricopeptide (TPR) repeat protein
MKSLLDPNENVLAQILSLNDRVSGFMQNMELPSNVLATYEADAQRSYKLGDFKEAHRHALQWFRYQPFSARPAIMASFVASLFLDNQEDAIRIIKEAEKAEPSNFSLNNNHVCSLALLNKVKEAADVLSKIQIADLDDNMKRIYWATTGLVAYRQGNIALGEEKYREAIEGFKKTENYRALVIATFYQAREIIRIKGSGQLTTMYQVLALARKHKINDMVSVIEKTCGENGKD